MNRPTRAWLLFACVGTSIVGVGIYSDPNPSTLSGRMFFRPGDLWRSAGPDYATAKASLLDRLVSELHWFNPELRNALRLLAETGDYQTVETTPA